LDSLIKKTKGFLTSYSHLHLVQQYVNCSSAISVRRGHALIIVAIPAAAKRFQMLSQDHIKKKTGYLQFGCSVFCSELFWQGCCTIVHL